MEQWNASLEEYDFEFQNSSEDLSSYIAFRDGSRFWIQRVLLPLVVVIGIIGNGMTVVVLSRRRMRSSTNTYLTALAVSDMLYLIFVFTLSLEHYPNIRDPSCNIYWMYWRFGVWLTDVATSTSIWLTVSFTVERYIAVCHPMRGKMLCTESRARMVIVLVYLFCFIVTITTPFEWETVTITKRVNNSTITVVDAQQSSLGRNKTYRTIFYWFWSISFVFLPLLLLGIFNSFLIHAVHTSRRTRCKMTQTDHAMSTQTQENKITITLIAVVILFLICQIPTAVTLIYTSFYRPISESKEDILLRAFGNIFNFLVAINAAANFMLYCALSAKYRRTLLATFLWRCYRTPSPGHSSVNTPEFSRLVRGLSTRSTVAKGNAACRGNSAANNCYLTVPNNGVLQRQTSLYKSKNDIKLKN